MMPNVFQFLSVFAGPTVNNKLWCARMKCALSDITIGTYGSINLNKYREASFKHEQRIGCLVEG